MPSMPYNIEVLVAYALGGGAFAAFALLPWIRRIPLDMHRGWAAEHQNYQPFLRDTSELDMPKASKVALVIGAALMCLGLALVRGASLDTAMLCVLLLGWILLVAINLRHELLPDRIVLALLWLGLFYRACTGPASDNVAPPPAPPPPANMVSKPHRADHCPAGQHAQHPAQAVAGDREQRPARDRAAARGSAC
jgi:hypothetical protein